MRRAPLSGAASVHGTAGRSVFRQLAAVDTRGASGPGPRAVWESGRCDSLLGSGSPRRLERPTGDGPTSEWAGRALGIRPIVGLVHHGSGPRDTNLIDPQWPAKLARYARAVAERYPWVMDWTPVNEPLTTARFSGLYGFWYPHGRDERTFVRALMNQRVGTMQPMQELRALHPRARLVLPEDFGVRAPRRRSRKNVDNLVVPVVTSSWAVPRHPCGRACVPRGDPLGAGPPLRPAAGGPGITIPRAIGLPMNGRLVPDMGWRMTGSPTPRRGRARRPTGTGHEAALVPRASVQVRSR